MDSNEPLDWRYMLADTRARVYLVWAFLATGGFIATHYNQSKKINGLWFFIILLGLGYMLKVMPLRVRKLRLIYLSWFIPLTIGLLVSYLAFRESALFDLIPYLGGYWLLVLAAGYFFNGLVDAPSKWYWLAVLLNVAAALAVFFIEPVWRAQYLVAAIISGWSMLNLWLFRVD